MSVNVNSLQAPIIVQPAASGVEPPADGSRALRPLTALTVGAPRPALLELPYTAGADPEIEADIRTVLEQITSAVSAELQPAAILVRGSLGRGEGGAIRAGRETQVTTDVELVAVYAGRNAMLRAWSARNRALSLGEALGETLALPQLDLVVVPARLLRSPPPSLASFEMLRSSRLLTGSIELGCPSTVPVERVPPADFIRRMRRAGNRLLLAWSGLGVGEGDLTGPAARMVQTTTDAAFLACGDTWLFRTRHYDHRLAVRAEWLRLPFAAGPGLTDRLREEYQIAARERLFPSVRDGLARAPSITRWEHAAVEWMGCFRACTQRAWWGRYGLGLPRGGVHPVRRAMEQMLEPARQRDRDGLGTHTQRTVLPLLLEWALDGWDDPARRDSVASLLGVKRDEARDLSYLVMKYLSAVDLLRGPTRTAWLPSFGP